MQDLSNFKISNLSSVLRPALVLLALFLILGIGGIGYQAIRTIQQLKVIEADRDHWQRPDDIIRALNLRDGNTVVDLGSGAGYFALKLSGTVGPKGEVLAVDLRQLSLFFLRVRALLQWKNNIRIIVGAPADPHLSGTAVDAVLIANTYHELTDPQSILRHISVALRQGGRLVIVDRAPSTGEGHHHAMPEGVEADLRKVGFNVVSREDHFIHPPGDELWWLIAASKP
jgi:ubiquinone/menaquinone biosynthesis C-methylase UbiE